MEMKQTVIVKNHLYLLDQLNLALISACLRQRGNARTGCQGREDRSKCEARLLSHLSYALALPSYAGVEIRCLRKVSKNGFELIVGHIIPLSSWSDEGFDMLYDLLLADWQTME
jgi:hypothetical protein